MLKDSDANSYKNILYLENKYFLLKKKLNKDGIKEEEKRNEIITKIKDEIAPITDFD